MDRVSVFARRQRIKNLEQWTIYAILTESFFLALFPEVAAAAVMLGVMAWFLRSRIDSRYKMRSLPFDVPVAIFLLIGAASVFLSSARNFDLIYNYFMLTGIYGLTYLIVGQTIRTPEQVKQVAQALGASAILVVLWGFFQFIFGIDAADIKWTDPDAFPELKKRVFSTLENPNVLAGYLDIFICLALGLLAKVESKSQKIILLAAIILLATCLTMTYSRGAFLTILMVFVIYALLQDWRMLIPFALIVGIISYADTTFTDRILSALSMSDSSEGVRVGIWVSTVAMISDHPFAGIGWGAYQFVYPQYNYYIADPEIIIYHAHNIYLNYAAEIGIVGALAFFWYFFGTMFQALDLGSNIRFKKLRNSLEENAEKIFSDSRLLQYVEELTALVNEKLSDFAERVLDLFGKKNPPPKENKPRLELVHHEEMKWGKRSRQKSNDDSASENVSVAGENISVKIEPSDSKKEILPPVNWEELTTLDDRKFLDGFKLGIGLAFLSMALNGLTDDLLFNIPSSILMWQLGALGAAIHLMPEEIISIKRRRRI